MTRYCVDRLALSGGTMIVALPLMSVVATAWYEPTVSGAQPSVPPMPSVPSKMVPHFFGLTMVKMLPAHAVPVENTLTMAFGTGMVWTFGLLVESCSACTANVTFSVDDGLITCDSAGDVLAPSDVLPAYAAVTVWVPTVRLARLIVATPETSAADPSVVVPSLKVTVPVGTAVLGAAGTTVAFRVSGTPASTGLLLEVSTVVVGTGVTDNVPLTKLIA